MSLSVGVRRAISLLVIAGMLAWLAWLTSMGRSKLDYVIAKLATRPALPACTWVPVATPALATLGLSFEPSHAWTARNTVLLAFRTQPLTMPAFVQLRVVAVAGSGIDIRADGGARVKITDAEDVMVPLHARRTDGIHVVSIRVGHPRPPHGNDRRWLGLAASAIRVCGAGTAGI